jgi:pilus assembly protein CpaB
MPRQRIILIIGIVLALAAVFLMTIYIDKQRKADQARLEQEWKKMQAAQTAVLVAKQDIPKGALVDEKMFETEIVLNKYVQPQAVTSMDRIVGMMTIAPISKGEQITLTKLTPLRTTGGLAEVTPMGKRAITISVDNISSLAGMIKAGDYVDVIAMIPQVVQLADGKQTTQLLSIPLFQNVLVLAVGQQISTERKQESRYKKEEEKKETTPLITLALAPQEANMIAFVQEQGKLRLILRSPADSKIEVIPPATWETITQYLMPQVKPQPPEEEKEVLKPKKTVEIYRGLNKEVKSLE